MERFLFVVCGAGFWVLVGGQGLHMKPIWVAVSAVLAALSLFGGSILVSPIKPKQLDDAPQPVASSR